MQSNNQTNYEAIVRECVSGILDVPTQSITMDTDIKKDYDIDSLDRLELHLAIEVRTGLVIDYETALATMNRVGDIVDYLNERFS